MVSQQREWSHWLVAGSLWLLIMILLLGVLYQVYTTLTFLFIQLLQSDWRPTNWNSYTISGLQRLIIFILGMVWLFVASAVQYFLFTARKLNVVWQRGRRAIVILLVTFLVSYGILYLF